MNGLSSASIVRRSLVAAFSLLVLAACQSLTDSPLPESARRLEPPAIYRTWWEMTTACAGRTGKFEAVSWYEVPGVRTFHIDDVDVPVNAYWSKNANRIVIAEEMVRSGTVVRHEMLHAILRNVPGHPRDQYLGRCAGVVECSLGCIADAGNAPAPDPAAKLIASDSLEVSVAVDPGSPSMSENDGAFRITVRVRNRASHPVTLLAGSGVGPASEVSYWYQLWGPELSDRVFARIRDVSATRFRGGEIKQYVWDFHVGTDRERGELPPGVYRVRGAYGIGWAEVDAFELRR